MELVELGAESGEPGGEAIVLDTIAEFCRQVGEREGGERVIIYMYIIVCIPSSRNIWRGIKFGDLAVCLSTAKLNPPKCVHVWVYGDTGPHHQNLNPPITSFGAKLPNFMTANIFGCTSSFIFCVVTYTYPSESHGGLYNEDEEEGGGEGEGEMEEEEQERRDDVMEVDQLIQEELGGWMEVKPHTQKKVEPKV